MVNITLSISEELKKELQKYEEVNWSAVIRKSLQEHLRKVRLAEEIAQRSKFTEKDAEELTKKVKREMAKQHGLVKN